MHEFSEFFPFFFHLFYKMVWTWTLNLNKIFGLNSRVKYALILVRNNVFRPHLIEIKFSNAKSKYFCRFKVFRTIAVKIVLNGAIL